MPITGTPISQSQWSTLMVQQLQALDPSVSAQVGTPERKIIDTIAYALATAQIDLSSLQNSLSIDGKVGSDLDTFVGLFGFSRQQGTYATGTVTFSAGATPVTLAIGIPYGTQVSTNNPGQGVIFDTIANAVIAVGQTSVDIPVRCETSGQLGNVAANTITVPASANTIVGIVSVTNAAATTNGGTQETDAALKTRFKNQVFRNVSGTTDQFLAIGLSGIFSTKANCLGPVSRYREYLQCPQFADNEIEFVSNGFGFAVPVTGNGDGGQYTTGISGNTYVKYFWADVPSFISNGSLDATALYFQPGMDYVVNTTAFAKDRGDAYRIFQAESSYTIAPPYTSKIDTVSGGSLTAGSYYYAVTAYTTTNANGYGETQPVLTVTQSVSGTQSPRISWSPVDNADGYNIYRFNVTTSTWSWIEIVPASLLLVLPSTTYTYIDSGVPSTTYLINPQSTPLQYLPYAFTPAEPPLVNTATLEVSVTDPNHSPGQPSVTFLNVYTGGDATVQAVVPGQVILFEYSYTSTESRNDVTRNVTNCVDLFVDGANPTSATTTTGVPQVGPSNFVLDPGQMLYLENFRRVGEPEQRPIIGNFLQPLLYTPILTIPSSILTPTDTYYEGIHYYGVQEVDQIGSTIKARDGLEWNPTVPGQAAADPVGGPYTGHTITTNPAASFTVPGYLYDKNVVDLQSACEGVKQSTTDVLVHSATTRYFKLDVTVVYSPGSNPSTVNSAIQNAMTKFLQSQYFGTVIQMSTLLNIIYNVSGVQNVQWTHDVDDTKDKVTYVDANGNPLTDFIFDRLHAGTPSAPEVQQAYITGAPESGTFTLSYSQPSSDIVQTSQPLTWIPTSSVLTELIFFELGSIGCIVNFPIPGSGTPEDPYLFTFVANGFQTSVITCNSSLRGAQFSRNSDFNLKDSELPALPTGQLATDTVPGLIIRQRAQDVWSL